MDRMRGSVGQDMKVVVATKASKPQMNEYMLCYFTNSHHYDMRVFDSLAGLFM